MTLTVIQSPIVIILLIMFMSLCAMIGGIVGERKGNPLLGFLFGAILGPFGVLIVLMMHNENPNN